MAKNKGDGTKRRRLSTEETNALLTKHGINIDNLPVDDAGHAQRMFNIAEAEGADVAFLTSEDRGLWIVFDRQLGMWSRHAAKQQIGAWVLSIGNLMLDWAETLKQKIATGTLSDIERAEAEILIMVLLGEGKRLRASRGISAVRSVAEAFPKYHIPEAEFDVDPDHIIVRNGVIDLSTGKLSPADPKYRLLRRFDVFFDPQAKAPHFDTFLKSVMPDPALRAWFQRCVGYWATGYNVEQALWILFGPSGTGKSTLIDAIYNVFGRKVKRGYAMKAPRGLFRKDQSHWGDTATLQGARLVVDSEYAEQSVVDPSLIKMLTGEQDITANKKYGRHVEFMLTGKFVMMTNLLPVFAQDGVAEDLEAILRRIFLVPMDEVQYAHAYAAGTYREMPALLKTEATGILRWIVEGAKKWYQEPLHVNVPLVVQEAMIQYRQRNNAFNPIWEPLKEAGFQLRDDLFTSSEELHSVVAAWHKRMKRAVPDIQVTTDWCDSQGLVKRRRQREGQQQRGYIGIGRP